MASRLIMKYLIALIPLVASCCTSTHPTLPPSTPRKVVLVHGFLDSGISFTPLAVSLRKQGFDCYIPRLKPCDGRGGLEPLAKRLKTDIDAHFGPNTPIQIVGFSMGGLVSRYYLQDLDGAKRCTTLITVATPHHGTQTAWLYPSKGCQQMRPNSSFLAQLQKSENSLKPINLVAFRTNLDLVVLPHDSAIWNAAHNFEYSAPLHQFLLYHPKVIQKIHSELSTPRS